MEWSAWLVKIGSISAEQLEDAVQLARSRSLPLPDALLLFGYVDCWTITRAFGVQYGYPKINFYNTQIPEEVILTVPSDLARNLSVCPVAIVGSVLWYATPHIANSDHRHQLCHILNRDAHPMWAPFDWVHQAEQKYYSVWHMTEFGSAWLFARYGDEDWLLEAGNHYREYVEADPAPTKMKLQMESLP